ncbi:pantothenate kinase [Russula earlei]|uniref:Pantothenate kinase n=1 Tax=Russula earlei TaxID=71964 RepID=A0ACC0TZI5_9AGAM|nr:pantothenate kinase [Russula earlei]
MSSPLPSAKVIHVNTRGAVILDEASPETRDSRGIYLPNYIEPVSHIAVDVGGSLAKVVYFTRSPEPPSSPSILAADSSISTGSPSPTSAGSLSQQPCPPGSSHPRNNGALTPMVLDNPTGHTGNGLEGLNQSLLHDTILRRVNLQHFPGGSLNFERFETDAIDDCIKFIQELIERSAAVNGVSIEEMKQSVKVMATGGGAHRFYDLFRETLDVEVLREDEMECLIEGLKFISLIPDEVYFFSDRLIQSVAHASTAPATLERPGPNPPKYAVTFEGNPTPQLPCLLVNIGSGVSIIKVDRDGTFERVSGTSLGGGTLWGLLSLLTPATSFDGYSFGKVFKKGKEKRKFSPEDISKSLLYAVSNNIGQIAYMNAEKYGLNRIYFGGCFIRGHPATIATLSYAIRFWSKGAKRALFLRHEGFLGAIGAWIKNIDGDRE